MTMIRCTEHRIGENQQIDFWKKACRMSSVPTAMTLTSTSQWLALENTKKRCPYFLYSDNFPVLLSDDFYKDSFFSSAVEFTVKNLLPWAEIEFAISNCHHNLSAHDLPLHMGVCVVFPDIVPVL